MSHTIQRRGPARTVSTGKTSGSHGRYGNTKTIDAARGLKVEQTPVDGRGPSLFEVRVRESDTPATTAVASATSPSHAPTDGSMAMRMGPLGPAYASTTPSDAQSAVP